MDHITTWWLDMAIDLLADDAEDAVRDAQEIVGEGE